MGHEDVFPLANLSGNCGFGERAFAGTRANGRDAPRAAILRVANNEEHGIIRETLVSRTMRDLVGGSEASF